MMTVVIVMKVDHQIITQDLNKSGMRILRTESLAKSVLPTQLIEMKLLMY